jgi:hypothetical protein
LDIFGVLASALANFFVNLGKKAEREFFLVMGFEGRRGFRFGVRFALGFHSNGFMR